MRCLLRRWKWSALRVRLKSKVIWTAGEIRVLTVRDFLRYAAPVISAIIRDKIRKVVNVQIFMTIVWQYTRSILVTVQLLCFPSKYHFEHIKCKGGNTQIGRKYPASTQAVFKMLSIRKLETMESSENCSRVCDENHPVCFGLNLQVMVSYSCLETSEETEIVYHNITNGRKM